MTRSGELVSSGCDIKKKSLFLTRYDYNYYVLDFFSFDHDNTFIDFKYRVPSRIYYPIIHYDTHAIRIQSETAIDTLFYL